MHSLLSLDEKANLLYEKIKTRDRTSFNETINFLMGYREELEQEISLGEKKHVEKGILLDLKSIPGFLESTRAGTSIQEVYFIPRSGKYLGVGKFEGVFNPSSDIDYSLPRVESKDVTPEEVMGVVDVFKLIDLVPKYLELESGDVSFRDFYKNPMGR
jgi:hypothetical protein